MKNILIWDIECVTFNFKLDKGFLMCVGYKYLGEKGVTVLTRELGGDPFDDKKLAKKAYDVISSAEGIITHNGKRFDVPAMNTRLLLNGLAPLPGGLRHFDTCEIMFKKLKMGNSLKNAISEFKLPAEKTALDLAGSLRAVGGDKKQYDWIVDHCKKDVEATEALYYKLAPLGGFAWSLAALADRPEACPHCAAAGKMQRRGWQKALKTRSPRFQCQSCGGWMAGKPEKLA